VSLFNQIYNQEASCRQSGADDAIVLEAAKQRYKNWTGGSEFKRFHWSEAMRHQPKWRSRSCGSSKTYPFIFSSGPATEEKVTRYISRDRAMAATRKGKGKEDSSSQSESFSTVGGIMSTLKKLSTSFAKAQL
jgi:hypothetical protein